MSTDIQHIQKKPIVHENIHESIFKSYHILEKVVRYLELNTPNEVILELIAEMKWTNKTK